MNYYTNKPTIYHEGEYVVRNYTEDQAANGMYYTEQEIETWKVKNTQDFANVWQLQPVLQEWTHRHILLTMRE